MKSDGRLDRNYLLGKDGDRINAILAGAGHNLRLVLAWLRSLFVRLLVWLLGADQPEIEPALIKAAA